jgi:nitroreductase
MKRAERRYNYEILNEIKGRWSPRAFSGEKVCSSEWMALLEAARFAPSCFNEQPWRFLVADQEKTLDAMRKVLLSGNQIWAESAPILIMILSVRNFSENGKINRWNAFDAGTAWGYLSLEAQRRGLITHAMGGFSVSRARETFSISDDWDILTIVAVGRYGDPEQLEQSLRKEEYPKSRKELKELIIQPDL